MPVRANRESRQRVSKIERSNYTVLVAAHRHTAQEVREDTRQGHGIRDDFVRIRAQETSAEL